MLVPVAERWPYVKLGGAPIRFQKRMAVGGPERLLASLYIGLYCPGYGTQSVPRLGGTLAIYVSNSGFSSGLERPRNREVFVSRVSFMGWPKCLKNKTTTSFAPSAKKTYLTIRSSDRPPPDEIGFYVNGSWLC
jgi:hypothetical protein